MDKVELYLTYVGLPVLIGGPIGALIFFMLIPRQLRMGCAIAFTAVWLVMGLLSELQPFHAIAKATGFATYLLIALAAAMHPGPRRRLAPMAWGYIVVALFSYLFILTVWDLPLAFVIRTQWLFLVIAALLVTRTIVDEESLMYVLRSLTIGLAIALLFPLSELVLHPGEGFINRRFNPYDANANHIGVLFALAGPFCLFGAMRTRNPLYRFAYIGALAAAAGMGLLTASRSTMIVMVGMSFPLIVALTRRPVMTALAGVIVVGAAGWFLGQAEINLERLGSLETGRVEVADEYLREVIFERPLLGMLETSGESFVRSEEHGFSHAHNAYLEVLYYGGIVYAVPKFTLVIYTCWCVLQMWLGRRNLPYDPLLISFLAAAMVMTYAHGMVNHSLDYPTTPLAFPHVLLSVLIMCLARDATHGTGPIARQAHEDLQWADVEYDDELARA